MKELKNQNKEVNEENKNKGICVISLTALNILRSWIKNLK